MSTLDDAFTTIGTLADVAQHVAPVVTEVQQVAHAVEAVTEATHVNGGAIVSGLHGLVDVAAQIAPAVKEIADAVPSNTNLGTLAEVVQAVGPLIGDVAATVVAAETGNVIGAVASGLKAVHDGAELIHTAAPAVREIVAEVGGAASQAYHFAASAAAHVVSNGVLVMIEHELGELPGDVKDRLSKLVHGLVHAATSFHILP